jgi:hypothetical protein
MFKFQKIWRLITIAALLASALNLSLVQATPAQAAGTTYTWNQTGIADWSVSTNWTPDRATPADTDILQFNGGGTVTATNVPTQTIAQLLLSNNTIVNLQAAASPTTLTISGDTGTDLDVPAGSALNFNGTTNALTVFLGAGATGSISGNMTCSTALHKLNAQDASLRRQQAAREMHLQMQVQRMPLFLHQVLHLCLKRDPILLG